MRFFYSLSDENDIFFRYNGFNTLHYKITEILRARLLVCRGVFR